MPYNFLFVRLPENFTPAMDPRFYCHDLYNQPANQHQARRRLAGPNITFFENTGWSQSSPNAGPLSFQEALQILNTPISIPMPISIQIPSSGTPVPLLPLLPYRQPQTHVNVPQVPDQPSSPLSPSAIYALLPNYTQELPEKPLLTPVKHEPIVQEHDNSNTQPQLPLQQQQQQASPSPSSSPTASEYSFTAEDPLTNSEQETPEIVGTQNLHARQSPQHDNTATSTTSSIKSPKSSVSKRRTKKRIVSKPQTREFQCPTCHRMFLRKQDMQRHEVTHDQVRAFVCPIQGCDSAFVRRDALSRHIKSGRCCK
ncbi:hypothetical protein BDR26DRAFT_1004013 [Obelidium mucronatum]|nr:hypothetical protein BDR26DRAFT_1004013 [Obelidium mucronatum]